ncbi:hypothetical protein F66182_2344 [Fusarium sp. NRRL 66182]|nr:hypothetical protein F66182_2344 [Fusarium sp. NRRL 66182]
MAARQVTRHKRLPSGAAQWCATDPRQTLINALNLSDAIVLSDGDDDSSDESDHAESPITPLATPSPSATGGGKPAEANAVQATGSKQQKRSHTDRLVDGTPCPAGEERAPEKSLAGEPPTEPTPKRRRIIPSISFTAQHMLSEMKLMYDDLELLPTNTLIAERGNCANALIHKAQTLQASEEKAQKCDEEFAQKKKEVLDREQEYVKLTEEGHSIKGCLEYMANMPQFSDGSTKAEMKVTREKMQKMVARHVNILKSKLIEKQQAEAMCQSGLGDCSRLKKEVEAARGDKAQAELELEEWCKLESVAYFLEESLLTLQEMEKKWNSAGFVAGFLGALSRGQV